MKKSELKQIIREEIQLLKETKKLSLVPVSGGERDGKGYAFYHLKGDQNTIYAEKGGIVFRVDDDLKPSTGLRMKKYNITGLVKEELLNEKSYPRRAEATGVTLFQKWIPIFFKKNKIDINKTYYLSQENISKMMDMIEKDGKPKGGQEIIDDLESELNVDVGKIPKDFLFKVAGDAFNVIKGKADKKGLRQKQTTGKVQDSKRADQIALKILGKEIPDFIRKKKIDLERQAMMDERPNYYSPIIRNDNDGWVSDLEIIDDTIDLALDNKRYEDAIQVIEQEINAEPGKIPKEFWERAGMNILEKLRSGVDTDEKEYYETVASYFKGKLDKFKKYKYDKEIIIYPDFVYDRQPITKIEIQQDWKDKGFEFKPVTRMVINYKNKGGLDRNFTIFRPESPINQNPREYAIKILGWIKQNMPK